MSDSIGPYQFPDMVAAAHPQFRMGFEQARLELTDEITRLRAELALTQALADRWEIDARNQQQFVVTKNETIKRLETELAALTAPVGEEIINLAKTAYQDHGGGRVDASISMPKILEIIAPPIRAQAAKEATEKERERIVEAMKEEADTCGCSEDAMVTYENALLIEADFSYDRLDELKEQDPLWPTVDEAIRGEM